MRISLWSQSSHSFSPMLQLFWRTRDLTRYLPLFFFFNARLCLTRNFREVWFEWREFAFPCHSPEALNSRDIEFHFIFTVIVCQIDLLCCVVTRQPDQCSLAVVYLYTRVAVFDKACKRQIKGQFWGQMQMNSYVIYQARQSVQSYFKYREMSWWYDWGLNRRGGVTTERSPGFTLTLDSSQM